MGEYYFLSRQMNLSKIIIWILFSQYLSSLYGDPSYLLYAYVVCPFTESLKKCNRRKGQGQGLWSPRMPVYDSKEIFAKCCKSVNTTLMVIIAHICFRKELSAIVGDAIFISV